MIRRIVFYIKHDAKHGDVHEIFNKKQELTKPGIGVPSSML
jgi:hypothetical protein